ncbi:rhodanese-like domain-containing protein [Dysgonomonas sp. 521]|uniref:rhodanese-like domain-containing protein n=1 Tax=Dysgonomonas sp. 521 TaxID=2302932 RepID=UPI0013D6B165|nr:rhodanese-like domain-containing protein [Dysgonomonas sp. 521]NDV95661.1 rhodanese-like domain-containing protein [Dysgonomonas sp. 521]
MASLRFSLYSRCKGQVADADTLKALFAKETTVIVDVRRLQEFEGGHFDGAVNMPLQSLGDSIESLQQYKDIIVICRSGRRSAKAKAELEEKGFANVYDGGGWKHLKEVLEVREEELQR